MHSKNLKSLSSIVHRILTIKPKNLSLEFQSICAVADSLLQDPFGRESMKSTHLPLFCDFHMNTLPNTKILI